MRRPLETWVERPGEAWRPIPDFEHYEVSDHGRIRTWKNGNSKSKPRRDVPKVLASRINNTGYCAFTAEIWENYRLVRGRRWLVHRLVATVFGKGDSSLHVAHLDGNPLNNHISNLKWCTALENNSHKYLHGTMPMGETHHNAKLCSRAVRAIVRLYPGHSQAELSRIFETAPSVISRIIKGQYRAKEALRGA